MPVYGPHENPNIFLRSSRSAADRSFVWIERIISEATEGPEVTELHKRLTVIASNDAQRRRDAFGRVADGLAVTIGSTMEVETEYGDAVSVHRTTEGTAMFDTRTKLPIHADDRSLGLVGWLNDRQQMAAHRDLFHVTAATLRSRVQEDANLIHLAQTPLDQLFELADKITSSERTLAQVQDDRSEFSETQREREVRESRIQAQLEEQHLGRKKANLFTYGALALMIVGIAVAVLVALPIGAGVCVVGVLVALVGKMFAKKASGNDASTEAMEMQLGRLDELFETQNLTSSRRTAEGGLAESKQQWTNIAGDADPSVLLKDRPRIEELASHLQLINTAQVSAPGDTSILVGFASVLAELARRFPAERVPLLVEDVFPEVPPQYHAVMRELLLRASHRRQVLLETADLAVAKWAALEAVSSNALLITDHDIDVESIIANAVDAETTPTV